MKRRRTEIEIRKESGLPFLLFTKTNKNYGISIFDFLKTEKGVNLTCIGSSVTYYEKKPKTERLENLVNLFFNKYQEKLQKEFMVRVGNRKVNNNYFAVEIIRQLKDKGVLINENFSEL
jgi:hypothetical protein